MILTPDELQQLTGRKRRDAQVPVLRHMGIEHRTRPDGSVVVLRAHVEQVLGLSGSPPKASEFEPDWDAIK